MHVEGYLQWMGPFNATHIDAPEEALTSVNGSYNRKRDAMEWKKQAIGYKQENVTCVDISFLLSDR